MEPGGVLVFFCFFLYIIQSQTFAKRYDSAIQDTAKQALRYYKHHKALKIGDDGIRIWNGLERW